MEREIAEPQEMVLKEQERIVKLIKAIAMRLGGNYLGDPWNALFVSPLLKYGLLRHMSGMPKTLK